MTQTPEQRRLIRLAHTINVKARRLGAEGEVTANDLATIFLRSRACHYCGVELGAGQYSFDHVLAFERGGTNWPDNIVIACFTCNRRKFTKTPAELETYEGLVVRCEVCQTPFRPRWSEWKAGRGRTCSRSCAASKRWGRGVSAGSTPVS